VIGRTEENIVKMGRLAIVITLINLVLLVFSLAQIRPATAQGVAPLLRGRALEIVDEHGRVRASITVNPSVTVDSQEYPESVLLRLSDPRGGPGVKLQASKDGSGLRLGDGRETGIDVSAKSTGSFLKVANTDGRVQLIRP
jgi:hypothetical protein